MSGFLGGAPGGQGASTFTELTDTPGSYGGAAGSFLRVTASASGIEFVQTPSGGGASAFTELADSPSSYSGYSGSFLRVKATEDGLEFVSAPSGGGASSFVDLADTPNAYSGQSQKIVRVRSDEAALEFTALPTFAAGNVAAKVRRTTNQTIPNTTVTYISFDTVEQATHPGMFNSASPTRLVAPVSGKYFVYATLEWSLASTTGDRDLHIRKNGTQTPVVSRWSGAEKYNFVSAYVDLNAGDYVEMPVQQTSGGNLDVVAAAWGGPRMGMILVGPIGGQEVGAVAYRDTAQTIPTGTYTQVQFVGTRYDTHGLWSSASSHLLTAPVAGKYIVQGTLQFVYNTSGIRQCAIVKRTPSGSMYVSRQGVGAQGQPLDVGGLIDMNAGDTVELWAYQNSGGNLDLNVATTTPVLLSLHLVSANGVLDVPYVTTASNQSLMSAVVIPGLASHGARAPASPNSADDEFDGTALDAKWTEFQAANHTVAVGSPQSWLRISQGAHTGNLLSGIFQAIPAGSVWEITTRAAIQSGRVDSLRVSFMLTGNISASPNTEPLLGLSLRAPGTSPASRTPHDILVQYYTNYTTVNSNLAGTQWGANEAYMKIARSGNTYTFSYSSNGVAWAELYRTGSMPFTPLYAGLFVDAVNAAGSGADLLADFYRVA